MKVITYLSYTMLSVTIQFVVIEYIQAQIKLENYKRTVNTDLNNTSPKKSFLDIMEQYAQRPHALYYQAPNQKLVNKTVLSKVTKTYYGNSSIENISLETSTTELYTTLLDLLYDENTTVTEDSYTTAKDSMTTSTEFDFDNVTEITFFAKKNKTNLKPKTLPKSIESKDCNCNLLYRVCDINCCCDHECTDNDRKMFSCEKSALEVESGTCLSQFSFLLGSNIDELFCVVKHNLPDKRNIVQNKHEPSKLEKHFKWHSSRNRKGVQEFSNKMYKYGDPIWLLRNGTIFYIDLPTPKINNYCSDRKPLKFLKEEKFKCIVKLRDLEIFQILSIADQTSVISVTEQPVNSALNCSTLHCTNWTILVCDELACTNYNKSLHDPLCTDDICTNLSLKIVYTFHYYENKIMNATIQLYSQIVPLNMPYIEQEIDVKFVIANRSVDTIVEYSGNPGYVTDLLLIVSYSKSNHTESFFNSTSKMSKYLLYPENIDGICTQSNFSGNFVPFMSNKRIKCRFVHNQKATHYNETITCKNIQEKITSLLGLDKDVVVSPTGNPCRLADADWIPLVVSTPDVIYGQFNAQKTKLFCYNMILRYSLIFSFADVSIKPSKTEHKILSAKVKATSSNVTLNVDDISTIVTFDTMFIDETKPCLYEYAGGPQLNIHLPRDFFFPFSSSTASLVISCSKISLVLMICLLKLIK